MIEQPESRQSAWCVIHIIQAGAIGFAHVCWALKTTRRTRAEAIAAVRAEYRDAGLNDSWSYIKRRGFKVVKCVIAIPGITPNK